MPLDVNKAFVVTISHTGKALSKHGQVLFFGPSKSNPTGLIHKFPVFLPKISSIMWAISRLYSVPFLDKLAVVLNRNIIKLALNINFRLTKEFCVWTRDLRVSICSANLKFASLCEVHKELTDNEVNSLRGLRRPKFLMLGPISEYLMQKINQTASNMQINLSAASLPMAASPAFYASEEKYADYASYNAVKIGYFGSFETMGVKSGINQFAKSLFEISTHTFELTLVGIGLSGRLEIESLRATLNLLGGTIEIVDYAEHREIPNLMRKFHILVLPYSESPFNLGRFPIKAVEYAASRVPILCSNTISHANILGHSKAFFYDINEPSSLSNAIEDIMSNKELRENKIKNAFSWALQLTYENRAKSILEFFTMSHQD